VFLLFVNNRLVESDKIRRVIDNAYAMYQPKGGYSYVVYMALSVRPDLIDVNVHPTKKQVIIERQDDLCELLGELIDFNLTQ
jgi:DNA mismatch repair protein MLH1